MHSWPRSAGTRREQRQRGSPGRRVRKQLTDPRSRASRRDDEGQRRTPRHSVLHRHHDLPQLRHPHLDRPHPRPGCADHRPHALPRAEAAKGERGRASACASAPRPCPLRAHAAARPPGARRDSRRCSRAGRASSLAASSTACRTAGTGPSRAAPARTSRCCRAPATTGRRRCGSPAARPCPASTPAPTTTWASPTTGTPPARARSSRRWTRMASPAPAAAPTLVRAFPRAPPSAAAAHAPPRLHLRAPRPGARGGRVCGQGGGAGVQHGVRDQRGEPAVLHGPRLAHRVRRAEPRVHRERRARVWRHHQGVQPQRCVRRAPAMASRRRARAHPAPQTPTTSLACCARPSRTASPARTGRGPRCW